MSVHTKNRQFAVARVVTATKSLRRVRKSLLIFVMTSFALVARADWHGGKVYQIAIGYDGSTVTFQIEGYARTNCTCYSAWPGNLCLSRARTSFKEELAMLYAVRARGTELYVNVDEVTCSVVAMYEIGTN
jgi:hypothetical protein